MNRFTKFSLVKRTDEPLRPSEKALRDNFHSDENTRLVYQTVMINVGRDVPYISIMDTMKLVFRQAISTDDHPSVSEMNKHVINTLTKRNEIRDNQQSAFTTRTFNNGNIPTRMLARPSMSIGRDEDDESRGKYTIELQR